MKIRFEVAYINIIIKSLNKCIQSVPTNNKMGVKGGVQKSSHILYFTIYIKLNYNGGGLAPPFYCEYFAAAE